jgi:hypothetical protein
MEMPKGEGAVGRISTEVSADVWIVHFVRQTSVARIPSIETRDQKERQRLEEISTEVSADVWIAHFVGKLQSPGSRASRQEK